MIDLKFILLTYLLGPVISVPYGLKYLRLSPYLIFFYLSLLYILALPVIFKALELGGHKKIYKTRIIRKICKSCEIKAEEEVERVKNSGDQLVRYFQKKLGHLGFYLAISLFTFLFGIFWAAALSYLLKVKRKRAVLAITIGILVGDLFWVSVIFYSLPLLNTQIIVLLVIAYLLLYGRKREIAIMKKVGRKMLKTS